MHKITAVVHEDIPANRLVCLAKPNGVNDEHVYIRLAKAKERPDFVSTRSLAKGRTVVIDITGEPIWEVEAVEDITAGMSIVTADEGKVAHMSNPDVGSETTIGYTLNSAKAGQPIKFFRIYKVKNGWIDKVNNTIDGK